MNTTVYAIGFFICVFASGVFCTWLKRVELRAAKGIDYKVFSAEESWWWKMFTLTCVSSIWHIFIPTLLAMPFIVWAIGIVVYSIDWVFERTVDMFER